MEEYFKNRKDYIIDILFKTIKIRDILEGLFVVFIILLAVFSPYAHSFIEDNSEWMNIKIKEILSIITVYINFGAILIFISWIELGSRVRNHLGFRFEVQHI